MAETKQERTERARLYRERFPEKAAAAVRKRDANGQTASLRWYYRNREKSIAAQKAWKEADPERAEVTRRKCRLKQQGVDISNLPKKPDGCTVCGSNKRLCLDHCHVTLRVRGWLCDKCNNALGRVDDNPETLRALADYLERT